MFYIYTSLLFIISTLFFLQIGTLIGLLDCLMINDLLHWFNEPFLLPLIEWLYVVSHPIWCKAGVLLWKDLGLRPTVRDVVHEVVRNKDESCWQDNSHHKCLPVLRYAKVISPGFFQETNSDDIWIVLG